jgi:DNA-binding Lrp family transcriptional regulator
MRKLLTSHDIQILQALCEVGPRNLSKVARTVGMSRKTLEFRIRRMQSNPQIFLRMHTAIYHTNLGLRKAVVVMEAKPGKEQLLFDCMKANGFWLYVCRSYGSGEGCTAIYTIPIEHCNEFEEFAHEFERLDIAESVDVHWSTCFQGGRITSEWFDGGNECWVFRWDDWMHEVETQTTDLPYTLIESKSYPVWADKTDVQMLMKLEKDATMSLSEVAKALGISRQLAQFHYKKHLIEKNLIESHEIFVMRYGENPFVMALLTVSFQDYATFARFAKSLLDKFFVITMGKALGENRLIVEVFLPTSEFRTFIDVLSTMTRKGLVRDYTYAIQDLRVRSRQTISGEFFNGSSWDYDHKSQVELLRQKAQDYLARPESPCPS